PGELAGVVPLVALLVGLSAWPNAISGHAFGAAPANAAIQSSLVESPGGANELLAAVPIRWEQGSGTDACRQRGDTYLNTHPSLNSGTVVLPCRGGRVRLQIHAAAAGQRSVVYSFANR